ncbi:NAD(P)-binding protein [Cryphonectria parasitica EP155]|uniref:NAD(P)-binding protein n=1 Tax=Cryphonectria parasitica (strain ATCC 38755 / EP155) TaxID=660469 RepID=A0A9P4Y474_CRYP1|nr:NAD(P)-binding protein [Cryphonectria parasitica EP155]KAF3766154.1 NAD(P)-binding protein [Cryphonectria parasitica EP155]
MAPIRIALIGLSANSKSGWAKEAHLPYLLSARGQARFQIIGLLNSSPETARRAAEAFHLPSPQDVRAYTSASDLAADPDVDLVVSSISCFKHRDAVKPSLQAGKDVLVEWPLAENADVARELRDLARASGSRTAVGTQARLAPYILKVREIVEGGTIGKVVNSEFRMNGKKGASPFVEGTVPVVARHFTDTKYGGNPFTIWFGHQWDAVQSIFKDVTDIHAVMQIQRPTVRVVDTAGNTLEELPTNVPDLLALSASIPASPVAREDATLLATWRSGATFPESEEPALSWVISGEKGSVRLMAPVWPHAGVGGEFLIQLHDRATDTVQPVEWKWEAWQESLPMPARNIGALYEAFADGEEGRYATFEDALKRQDELESMLAGFRNEKKRE